MLAPYKSIQSHDTFCRRSPSSRNSLESRKNRGARLIEAFCMQLNQSRPALQIGDRLVTRSGTLLNIKIENACGVVTVRCYGRLVYGRECALFCAAVTRHRRNIFVDLSGVTSIDAAGIGVLVSLQDAGTRLRVVDPSETIRQVLTLTNLDSAFDISYSGCGKETMVPNTMGRIGIHSTARISSDRLQ
jgi:anti-anti-sigma factor